MMKADCKYKWVLLLVIGFCFSPIHASENSTGVMVLDFELKDLTIYENNQDEIERTKTLKPMLEQALVSVGRSDIIQFDISAQHQADLGHGYLYDHHDVVSKFANENNANWVVVSRVHKPSYLFVYLKSQLIDVSSESVVGRFSVELKGQQEKFIKKGMKRLAVQINEAIDHYSQ